MNYPVIRFETRDASVRITDASQIGRVSIYKGLNMKKKAFTLIELLVVIAIIALLLSIITPALKKAKDYAKTTICKTNFRTLSMAWFMYSGDNGGELCRTEGGYGGITDNQAGSWAFNSGYIGAEPIPAEQNWETAEAYRIRQDNIAKGVLWPYINSYDAYGCPADRQAKVRIRSYSMNYTMNGIPQFANMYGAKIAKKMSEISSPSSRIVFATKYFEADNAFEIRGAYRVIQNDDLRGEYATPWHNQRSNLGFADGHGETRPWGNDAAVQQVLIDRKLTLMYAPDSGFLVWLKNATNVTGKKPF